MQEDEVLKLWVGSYASANEASVFLCSLLSRGEIKIQKEVKAGEKTSYLTYNEKQNLLFAINEVEDFENAGAVVSFKMNNEIQFCNRVASGGKLPVSLCFSENNNRLLVANYTSGTIAVFSINPNGTINESLQIIQHTGSGPNKKRQKSAHVHQIIESPNKNYVFAIDLGTDEIRSYVFRKGKLASAQVPIAFKTHLGFGPRQLVFHPNGQFAFLVHEIKSQISFLKYFPQKGIFEEIKTLSTIPQDYSKQNKCGGVAISANGKTVYVSNRGHDSVASFSVNAEANYFELLDFTHVEGKWPREFCITSSGKLLVVACQKSNELTSFRIDGETGKLFFTGYRTVIKKPVFCMMFEK